jgi:hypothetical protein
MTHANQQINNIDFANANIQQKETVDNKQKNLLKKENSMDKQDNSKKEKPRMNHPKEKGKGLFNKMFNKGVGKKDLPLNGDLKTKADFKI